MSRIINRYLNLAELARRSDLIVLAAKAKPAMSEEKVAIHPNKNHCPPYVRRTYHFIVQETLHRHGFLPGEGDDAAPGEAIRVRNAHEDRKLAMYRAYYLDGVRLSPIFDHYRGDFDYDAADELMLFLRLTGVHGTYQFAAGGGYESVAKKDLVRELLGR